MLYSLTRKIYLTITLLSKRLRKVVLLAVVLIPTKLVQPLLAMFIDDNSQRIVIKQAAANFNQGTPVIRTPISDSNFGPPGFPPVQNNHVQNQGNNQNRYNQNPGNFNQAPAYQPPFIKLSNAIDLSASRPNQKASIPFPSRRNDERRREKANDQIEKFYELCRRLSFEFAFRMLDCYCTFA
ncbi:hypothetical protein Tco_0800152 [Tanacetum coccineum]|uniref:Uncharacterized protein n=1 Tax=Tanacetum coccineum TaxID=301880 RepID=A0ABQ4ZSC3_9ASTR